MNKKTFFKLLVLPLAVCAMACTDYQSSIDELDNRVDNMDKRVTALEESVKAANDNIKAIQEMINAQKTAVYITKVTNTADGYEITLSNGKTITVHDGKNGNDGSDGHTPQVSVKQFSDGNWYWTVDGQWMLDSNGSMVRVTRESKENKANRAKKAKRENKARRVNKVRKAKRARKATTESPHSCALTPPPANGRSLLTMATPGLRLVSKP